MSTTVFSQTPGQFVPVPLKENEVNIIKNCTIPVNKEIRFSDPAGPRYLD